MIVDMLNDGILPPGPVDIARMLEYQKAVIRTAQQLKKNHVCRVWTPQSWQAHKTQQRSQ